MGAPDGTRLSSTSGSNSTGSTGYKQLLDGRKINHSVIDPVCQIGERDGGDRQCDFDQLSFGVACVANTIDFCCVDRATGLDQQAYEAHQCIAFGIAGCVA